MRCLRNVVLTAVRFSAWTAKGPAGLYVSCPQVDDTPSTHNVNVRTLTVRCNSPGRALSNGECDAMLAMFGTAPVDVGGGTGLALFVARTQAEALGGTLGLERGRTEGVCIQLEIPVRVPDRPEDPPGPPPPPLASSSPKTPQPAQAASPKEPLGGVQHVVPPFELTQRMFEYLCANSEDAFALARLEKRGDSYGALLEYVSPNIAAKMGYAQQQMVGMDMLEMTLPEDRPRMDRALAHAMATDGRFLVTHRSVCATGDVTWCDTAGLVAQDRLYLVCRDVTQRKEDGGAAAALHAGDKP